MRLRLRIAALALASAAVVSPSVAWADTTSQAPAAAPAGRGVPAATGVEELPLLPLAALALTVGLVGAGVAGHRAYDGS